ncbi:hypothetical protein BKG79_22420 [Mycobacteroides chelonae]|uniref:hypothetical protein n=1 Tax=Mycobacteroides chelonae TaxID=1774 RepID=UPI0008A86F3C|nr:hypothetical protein [Mycobacteroides chelonae]OHU33360.1 hypothetical protein BKG79_22420 [Mycobacteroides chelonae]
MTGKITIKDRATVQGHITNLVAVKTKLTAAAERARTEQAAVIAALAVSVDGNTGGGAPAAGNPGAQADAAATALGTATTGMQSWLDGLETVDTEGATGVQSADGGTPEPTEPKPADPKPSTPTPTPAPAPTTPQAKPYSTSGGTTGGTSPYPAG